MASYELPIEMGSMTGEADLAEPWRLSRLTMAFYAGEILLGRPLNDLAVSNKHHPEIIMEGLAKLAGVVARLTGDIVAQRLTNSQPTPQAGCVKN